MPIRAYLEGGHSFDGETIRQMGIAFEMALAALGPTRRCDDLVREALARNIIALAEAGERNLDRLWGDALKALSLDPDLGQSGQH
jgi:hypothetical protein